jgi:hypothetical protein
MKHRTFRTLVEDRVHQKKIGCCKLGWYSREFVIVNPASEQRVNLEI